MLQVASFGGGNDNKNPPILHTSPDNRFDAGNLLGMDDRITGLTVYDHAKRSRQFTSTMMSSSCQTRALEQSGHFTECVWDMAIAHGVMASTTSLTNMNSGKIVPFEDRTILSTNTEALINFLAHASANMVS
jgi:hypothetical protein